MNLKLHIDERARELYKENCPYSYQKCEDMNEVDYKIQRMVDLGKLIVKDLDLSFAEVIYHKKKLVLLNGKLIDMFVTNEDEFRVSERSKENHYNTYYKRNEQKETSWNK